MNIHEEIYARFNELTDEKLIQLFYGHEGPSFAITDSNELSEKLISVFLNTKTEGIINIIRKCNYNFAVDKKDVPQFSDIDEVAKVPFFLKNCGIDGVGYAQMGYMMRRESRKIGADRKYGENHMKTACQMSLCKIVGFKAFPNELGNVFSSLQPDEKKIVFPKLCLSIPFIQNYFMNGCSNIFLEEQLNILSESTKGRRRPNVNTLISIINEAIKNGI